MTRRGFAALLLIGLAVIVSATIGVLALVGHDLPSPPADPVGRYRPIALDGRLYLVDTTTGAARRLEWIEGDYEWWSVVGSVDDSMHRHWRRIEPQEHQEDGRHALVPSADLPPGFVPEK